MWAAHDGMGWWMLFGSVFWVVFIGALVYLFASTFGRGTETSERRSETPQEIAKRRLAAGEISHEEYERLREILNRS
ncbi:MAG: SHOCT domain-containing protein [Dehalococcoidia bacterium]